MKDFKKIITALITPFKNGHVDFKSIEKLVQHQLQDGIEGFVINGTTAESPTLEANEREEIFKSVRGIVGNDFPLIMGTGSNSTKKTIEASIEAENIGADAVLVVVPYYNKPPQRGLVEHFNQVANAISIPTILYNVPGRTITSLDVASISELAKNPKIIGIKEASGKIDFAIDIKKATPQNWTLLSGDDGTFPAFMHAGGQGTISVLSHLIPGEMVKWRKQAASKDFSSVQEIEKWTKLIDLLFVEPNPIPVKMATHYMGLIESPEVRLPLVTMSSAKAAELKLEMKKRGLI